MAHTYRTDLMFTVSAGMEATEHNLALRVEYVVHDGCEATRWQPGEGATVGLHQVWVEVPERFGGGIRLDPAPEWISDAVESDEALTAELLQNAWEDNEAARDQAADHRREEVMLSKGASA